MYLNQMELFHDVIQSPFPIKHKSQQDVQIPRWSPVSNNQYKAEGTQSLAAASLSASHHCGVSSLPHYPASSQCTHLWTTKPFSFHSGTWTLSVTEPIQNLIWWQHSKKLHLALKWSTNLHDRSWSDLGGIWFSQGSIICGCYLGLCLGCYRACVTRIKERISSRNLMCLLAFEKVFYFAV